MLQCYHLKTVRRRCRRFERARDTQKYPDTDATTPTDASTGSGMHQYHDTPLQIQTLTLTLILIHFLILRNFDLALVQALALVLALILALVLVLALVPDTTTVQNLVSDAQGCPATTPTATPTIPFSPHDHGGGWQGTERH